MFMLRYFEMSTLQQLSIEHSLISSLFKGRPQTEGLFEHLLAALIKVDQSELPMSALPVLERPNAPSFDWIWHQMTFKAWQVFWTIPTGLSEVSQKKNVTSKTSDQSVCLKSKTMLLGDAKRNSSGDVPRIIGIAFQHLALLRKSKASWIKSENLNPIFVCQQTTRSTSTDMSTWSNTCINYRMQEK